MGDFKIRLQIEEYDLGNKIEGLSVFINSPKFLELSNEMQELMKKQLESMSSYYSILIERLLILGIPVLKN